MMVSLSISVHTSLSRVSSLKRLLKAQPNSPPPSPSAAHSDPALLERLPTTVFLEIGRQSDLRDVLHLSLCSHRLSKMLAPVLFHTVELKTNKQCKSTLITLAKRPEVMQHIRRLVVRPNSVEWTDPADEMDEDLVACLIARMADRLRNMEAFEWDGMEMPDDGLWSALKTSCRRLKRIATSVGDDAFNPSSPLWDFDDLRQVSLKVKCRTLDWVSDGLPKPEKLPRKFWAMLLERCPRLEELSIDGPTPSPRIFDIRHVTSGRWPRLRSITLGDMLLIDPSKGEEQSRKDHASFMAFFIAHPSLKHISLQHGGGSAYFPGAFVLPPSALPNVHTFGGPLKFVKTLPFPQRLRHLTLTSLHHTPSSFPATFAVLQELRWLESLSIWIDLSFGASIHGYGSLAYGKRPSMETLRGQQKYDDMQIVKNLLVSRPGLKHLELSYFTRPTFSVREFSSILQTAPSLESFVLTKVYKSSEEDMTRSAVRLVTQNPNIRKFTLKTTHDLWFTSGGGRVKQLGIYEALELVDATIVDLTTSASGSVEGSSEDFGRIPSRTSTVTSVSPSSSFPSSSPLSLTPLSSTPVVALLAREWGQWSIMGKEHWKHFIHPVSPPTRNSPPSSWTGHSLAQGMGIKKHGRAQSISAPSSFSSSSSQNLTWRPRRASCSSVGGSVNTLAWDSSVRDDSSQSVHVSSRSSFSSMRGLRQGSQMQSQEQVRYPPQVSQVTWAPSVNTRGRLGRSGSASSESSYGEANQSCLTIKKPRRISFFGRKKESEVGVDEEYVFV
ncbi:hypothetical protein CPB84DRAFT_1431427 [Gymnopilus junonius]|uniref:F-box domain-containing protein n=1 Tax=Gymnopilus junonius TaxID=109634 RepID=A0A9P5NUF3_GYMJU|nr:hypothetical protein CPB84DRAFT_1431427 [Gymnopilus junonius]